MKVYVVTYHDCTGEQNELDGVYGVFSSQTLAESAIFKYVGHFKEEIREVKREDFRELIVYYTDKSIYAIDTMELDDAGI